MRVITTCFIFRSKSYRKLLIAVLLQLPTLMFCLVYPLLCKEQYKSHREHDKNTFYSSRHGDSGGGC
jgi:hypothetical protein